MWKGTHRGLAAEMSVWVLDIRVRRKTVSHIGDRPAGYNIQGCRRHHMSILDEGENLFDHHESKLSYDYLTATKNVDGRVSMIHIVKCACDERIDAANCSRCIGHKYNTKHGCPVCGATWVAYPFEKIYQCNTCGSVIIPCGFGDVRAVGVIDEAFRIEEGDTI